MAPRCAPFEAPRSTDPGTDGGHCATQTVLPLTGLDTPLAVTVDTAGNVYVADRGNDMAVKLAV